MTEPHRDEIAKLEALHREHPEGRVFTHLAEAYRKAGEHGRALETIEAGLVRHAEYASAHVVRGRVLLDLGQQEGAAAAFRNVLELDRHNLIALRALGELARDGGRPEEALGYFRELLTIDPADPGLSAEIDRLEGAIGAESAAAEPGGLAEQAAADRVVASPAESAPVDVAAKADAEPGGMEAPPADLEVVEEPTTADGGWEPTDEREPIGTAEGPWIEEERDAPVEDEAPVGAGWEDDLGAATWEDTEGQGEEAHDFLSLDGVHLPASDSPEPEVEDRPWPDSWWSGESGTAASAEAEAEPEWAGEPESAAPDAGSDFHWTFPGWGEEEEAVEVRTETMAALYASQGLWGRAAEIYRGLLAERPGDAGLEERLRDAESRIEQGAEPESGGGSEQWLEGVESAWTGGQGVAAPSASPYDWEEDAEDAAPGPSAGEYLRSLAEWRPGLERVEEALPESELLEADEGEAALREWLAEEPAEPETAGESDWPPRSAMEPSGEEPAGEEDEDVEMFRTWLQSLRK